MATLGNLVNRLSGGAANSQPSLSLGGVMSSATITSQTVTAPTQVTGVTIKFAHKNQTGTGTLKYNLNTNSLSWRPPASAVDHSTTLTGSGDYFVGNAIEGFIVVNVAAGSLPAGSRTDTLGVAQTAGTLFDTVQPAEALSGRTEYRCSYIYNTGDTIMYNVKVWIKQQTTGEDSVLIGLDPAGVGNGTTTGVALVIANETDSGGALTSTVTFSNPSSAATALVIGDLAPNRGAAIWEKRIVPPNTTQQDLNNNYIISVAADIS